MRREKIVLLAMPGIGDALLSTPMIELLRRAKPEAEIHAFVMFAATREMFEQDPYIDRVHHYDFLNGSKSGALKFVSDLRKMRFDISINIYPQNRREYNLIAFLIGAKQRIGVRYRRRDPQNLSWLNTKTILEDDTLHCVEENVRLLSLIDIPHELGESSLPPLRLTLSEKHLAFADQWCKSHLRGDEQLLIGFHAGTALFKNHIRRRWAPEKFAELAKRLTSDLGARVLLFGGPDDSDANREILSLAGECITMVETKSILDSVAVMRRLNMFVSNDSALMHIAGALELPTVAIFGPTNETYVHPWRTRYTIVHTGIECRPCFIYSPKPLTCYRKDPSEHFICIRAIEVARVFNEAKMMAKPDPMPPAA
ncbi:MAG: glycosyltransferase family 9 protein [Bacteroidota bacterium]|nr:glycosyltransferase family 9 protein [Bacteroidota bacterium]MDP4234574.1 glycosyltransferase family 9 protein [Bacteroidota bacterium]MDP4243703.1 glycosyltransferase family 9 protein [Bacteroidota bacterium]MDP4288349.1 glycosyltransferase family 9 protein [Bacteroidota bacterium]